MNEYKRKSKKIGAKTPKKAFSYNSKDNKKFLDIIKIKKLIDNLNL